MYINNEKRLHTVKHFGTCCIITADPSGVFASVRGAGDKAINPQENSMMKILFSSPFGR